MSIILVSFIVFFLSIIQSIIGVGLLVFGTPTLIMLGYSFQDTLATILPPSILISLLQVIDSPATDGSFRRDFNRYCLPFVLLGIVIVLIAKDKIDLKYCIGIMLVLSALIRFVPAFENFFFYLIKRYGKLYLVLMGCVHGLTNMGGGLLSLFSGSIHQKDKIATRSGIAYGYLLMGIIQYLTLIIYNTNLISSKTLSFAIIAPVTYLALGKKLFIITREEVFHRLITIIILVYGIMLILK